MIDDNSSVRNSLIAALQGMGYSSMGDVMSPKPQATKPRPQVSPGFTPLPNVAQQYGISGQGAGIAPRPNYGTMQGNPNGGRPAMPIQAGGYTTKPLMLSNQPSAITKPLPLMQPEMNGKRLAIDPYAIQQVQAMKPQGGRKPKPSKLNMNRPITRLPGRQG